MLEQIISQNLLEQMISQNMHLTCFISCHLLYHEHTRQLSMRQFCPNKWMIGRSCSFTLFEDGALIFDQK